MIDRGSHNIVGVRVHAVDYESAVARIIERRAKVRADVGRRRLGPRADDERPRSGPPLSPQRPRPCRPRWATRPLALNRLHSAGLRERVYGPQLTFEVCRGAAEAGLPIFVFGAADNILRDLRRQFKQKLPNLQIAGMRPAKYCQVSTAERDALVDEVRASGARIMLVGLGCPRQEVFVYEMRDILSMPTLAVGAALNFHAGHLPQAPPLLQRYGLEWAFRLASEPRRLWKRYLLHNPPYFWYLGLQATGLYTMDPEDARPPQQEMCYG